MIKYKAAIVGCGRIASLFSKDPLRKGIVTHAAAYKDNPQTELVAACDIDSTRLKEFGKTWRVKSLYTNFEDMLKKEAIDILSVCSWDSTHYGIVKNAAKNKVKAIFCEKPISDNLNKADEMVKLCSKNRVVLAVNHSRRWDQFEHKIRDYIQQGGLGRIQCASAYYTGGITNTGTHLLDLLRFFFGDAQWVWSNPILRHRAQDPVIDGYIYFNSGFGCFLHGLDVKAYLIFEIDIYGTKGRLRIKNSGFDSQAWIAADSPRFSGYKELKEVNSLFKNGYKNVLKNALRDIFDCIKNKNEPFSSGRDGVKALELICALRGSLRRNGKTITLPLKNRNITIKTK